MHPRLPPEGNGFTPRQMEILEELSKLAPELGALYMGALRIISDDANPARVYFMAHAVREIGNNLPKYLDIPLPKKRVEYVNRLDQLAPRWKAATQSQGNIVGPVAGGSSPQAHDSLPQLIPIPGDLFLALDSLFDEHIASRMTRREAAKLMMASMDSSAHSAPESYLVPIVQQWIELVNWFVGSAHVRAPQKRPPSFQECMEKFRVFEDALYALVCPFYGAVEELDAILEETNPRTS